MNTAKDYDMSAGFSDQYRTLIVNNKNMLAILQQHASTRWKRQSNERTEHSAAINVREYLESATKLIKGVINCKEILESAQCC